MENKTAARPGQLLCMTSGCYSDYDVEGFFVVLRAFVPADELEAYLDANPGQRKAYNFDRAPFVGALIQRGLVMLIDYGTLHLGEYSNVDTVEFRPFNANEVR